MSTYRLQLERERAHGDVRLLLEGLYHYNVEQTGRDARDEVGSCGRGRGRGNVRRSTRSVFKRQSSRSSDTVSLAALKVFLKAFDNTSCVGYLADAATTPAMRKRGLQTALRGPCRRS